MPFFVPKEDIVADRVDRISENDLESVLLQKTFGQPLRRITLVAEQFLFPY